ncbi:GIY-YIG nuclease family protein [Candidatus Nomurabacteria bacterium]|nr:GIY-YIG nuclease family protein [Candidatus Nomurabacteria bacterium]
MDYFVYILISDKDHKLYVGCTTDLEKRLKRHNSGQVSATKRRIPFSLLYSEKYDNKSEAFNRERFLKSLWSARFKRKLKDEYINKVIR